MGPQRSCRAPMRATAFAARSGSTPNRITPGCSPFDAVATATSAPEEAVRAFLASRSGRHFGDDVAKAIRGGRDVAAAIDGVVERWMELRITPLIEEEIGIPEGLPYLTGFVLMQEALLNPPP